jgi:hypothetical protein
LHLQWTSTPQPRINKNQERLIEEVHATAHILISRIGWCKEKKNTRERSCSRDLKPWALTGRKIG